MCPSPIPSAGVPHREQPVLTPAALPFDAILMAAGAGSRLGHRPKCLLQLGGVPLILRQISALKAAGVDDLVVVLGYYADDIAPLLSGTGARVVQNPDPAQGQISSQRIGLQQLRGRSNAVLMALADQPLIDSQDLVDLIASFARRQAECLLMFPQVQGQPGNPVIFAPEVRDAVLSADESIGCRQWRQANRASARPFDSDNQHYLIDIDTQEDIDSFCRTTGLSLSWPADRKEG
jgi:molybdenum cofactor cytidylyltransferase